MIESQKYLFGVSVSAGCFHPTKKKNKAENVRKERKICNVWCWIDKNMSCNIMIGKGSEKLYICHLFLVNITIQHMFLQELFTQKKYTK